jgi:xylulokinase
VSEVTVGIDIGTGSVKAVAADADGNVVAWARVPHALQVPAPNRMQHDDDEAWRRGPRRALEQLGDVEARAVSVAAMVPSLTAVDGDGVPRMPGLLYGDERGRTTSKGNPAESGELLAFMKWFREEYPEAKGFWPAQAVANHALGGDAVLDTSTASTAYPLFDWTGWDESLASDLGVTTAQLPRLVPTAWECGRVDGPDGPVLASGCIDALAEQIVAGADNDGDVIVILGTTLIVWGVTTSDKAPPGHYSIPHTTPGKMLVGGPSNAGGLFVNWATSWLAEPAGAADPGRVPVWAPYPRGERVPYQDPELRGALGGLDLTHDAAAIRRAVLEASGFVTRRMLDTGRDEGVLEPRRIVATGGGIRNAEWVQALADCTGLPVDCVAVPEGGALGSAFLARMSLGLETNMVDGSRWARTGRRVEPDALWASAVADRYDEFLALSPEPAPPAGTLGLF